MKNKMITLIGLFAVTGCSILSDTFPVVNTKAYETVRASEGGLHARIEAANWMCAYVMKETDDQEGEDFFNNENLLILEHLDSLSKSRAVDGVVSVKMQDAYSSFDSFFDGSERRNQLFNEIWDDCDSLRASK